MELYEKTNKWVGYYFDEEIGMYTFKKGHPMRPFRVKVTDSLISAYGLQRYMQCYDSSYIGIPETNFTEYHSQEYIDLLRNINEDNFQCYSDQFQRFGFSSDCPYPTNSRIYDLCKLYTDGSVLGAVQLCQQQQDIFINWSGGLHHAKRQEASGFCYINDCVLAILEMLKTYPRVLYVDIDAHHGDGVEEAFFTTNRVLTCSFHKYKDFFPGTGHINDIGADEGIYHSVNFPLNEGIDDITYEHIFVPVINQIFESFRPSAVLLQCGTDSLSGDKLGPFNLSIQGHGKCVQFIKSKNVPLLMVGGGGYTIRNIARAWTYETSVALGTQLDNTIPEHEYSTYFYPENQLQTQVSNMENMNKKNETEELTRTIIENLKNLQLYSPEMTVEDQFKDQSQTWVLEQNKIKLENQNQKN